MKWARNIARVRDRRSAYKFLFTKIWRRYHFEYFGVIWRILLKYIRAKEIDYDSVERIYLARDAEEKRASRNAVPWWTLGLHKKRGISWPAERTSGLHEGHHSTKYTDWIKKTRRKLSVCNFLIWFKTYYHKTRNAAPGRNEVTHHQDVWGGGGTAPHTRNLGVRWRWVDNSTALPLYQEENCADKDWTGGSVGQVLTYLLI
jgi:hypothetical protein